MPRVDKNRTFFVSCEAYGLGEVRVVPIWFVTLMILIIWVEIGRVAQPFPCDSELDHN